MMDEVMSGSSYYSQNSFTLHFGLGGADERGRDRDSMAIGNVQQLGATAVRQNLHVTEATSVKG